MIGRAISTARPPIAVQQPNGSWLHHGTFADVLAAERAEMTRRGIAADEREADDE